MTGRHIREVFKKPQRIQIWHSVFCPIVKLKSTVIVKTGTHSFSKFLRMTENIVASIDNSDSIWVIDFRIQPGVIQSVLSGGDPHLDFPTHKAATFFDSSHRRFFQRAVIVNISRKVPRFTTIRGEQMFVGNLFKGSYTGLLSIQSY